jgi:hypothetical protein
MPQYISVTAGQLAILLLLSFIAGGFLTAQFLVWLGRRAVQQHLARQQACGKPWPVDATGHPRRRASDKAEHLINEVKRELGHTVEREV